MSRKFLPLLFLPLAALCCACGSGTPASAPGAARAADTLKLSVMPESFLGNSSATLGLASRQLGNELLVTLEARDAVGLKAVYCGLDFDPALLTPLTAAPTAEFGEAGQSLQLLRSSQGHLDFGQVLIHPAGQPGFSGNGVLATLRFALAPQAELPRSAAKVNENSKSVPLQPEWHDGSKQLSWFYNNPADYDQNGEVNVADLTPLALYFNATNIGGFPLASAESVVDGDGNGVINLADISTIGQNFGNSGNGGYTVFEIQNSVTSQTGVTALSEALGDKSSERLHFLYTPPTPLPLKGYFMRLTDSSGKLGFPADPVFVPADNPPFIVLDFLDKPAQGTGSVADPFILTDAIIGNSFTFRITDESVNVTGGAGVEIRASDAGAVLSIDQPTGEVQFDPAYSETPFYMDGVSGGLDTQNRLYFNYIPEPKVEVWIMPDPADLDWNDVEGEGTQASPFLVRNLSYNSMGQIEFSFIANSKEDGSGDVIDVNTLTWGAEPTDLMVFNNWTPPGTAKFHPTLTDGYVFALNADNIESNHIYVKSKALPTT